MDNPDPGRFFFRIMSQQQSEEQPAKLVTPASLLVDAVVVGAFWVGAFLLCRSHVPSYSQVTIVAWSALTATCMSGVFWLVLQMFRVVLRAQRAEKKK